MDDPFIWVRAIHFCATILVSGIVLFTALIAEPVFRKTDSAAPWSAAVRYRLKCCAWAGLAVVLISGTAWFFYATARMADLPLAEAYTDPALWTVLTQTTFGHAWTVRLALTAIVAISLPTLTRAQDDRPSSMRLLSVPAAAALAGTLAWSGHAAAGTGIGGAMHLASDILHLIAAAAWLGGLLPLAVLLHAAAQGLDHRSTAAMREAVARFSMLGIASVGTLLVTGIINSWLLVGGMAALLNTNYGRLLLLKIALFLSMLAIAGINRQVLTPRLRRTEGKTVQVAVRQIGQNSLIEAALGATILLIVGLLGTMQPGIDG